MLNQVFITLWFDSPSDSRAPFFLLLFLFFFIFHSIPLQISVRNDRVEASNDVRQKMLTIFLDGNKHRRR